jgi:hypothetical protein
VATEAVDGSQDVIGRLDPSEGFWLGIVRLDVGVDGGFKFGGGAMHAAAHLALGEQAEEALDLVDLGCRGRGEVEVPAGPFGEPVADALGLVRSGIVDDEMGIEIVWNLYLSIGILAGRHHLKTEDGIRLEQVDASSLICLDGIVGIRSVGACDVISRIPRVLVGRAQLVVVFCGINPRMTAAAVGHHFARRGNRFWRVIHLAGFTPEEILPENDRTIPRHRCGLTATWLLMLLI